MSDWFLKDPDETLDYQIDWADWLGSDTIVTSTWAAEAGVTLSAASNTTTSATTFVAAGTHGRRYLVTNRITTTGGRTAERSLLINVAAK